MTNSNNFMGILIILSNINILNTNNIHNISNNTNNINNTSNSIRSRKLVSMSNLLFTFEERTFAFFLLSVSLLLKLDILARERKLGQRSFPAFLVPCWQSSSLFIGSLPSVYLRYNRVGSFSPSSSFYTCGSLFFLMAPYCLSLFFIGSRQILEERKKQE